MIRIERINARNVWDILRLSVAEEQRAFVADNTTSIVEAYTTLAAGGHVFPFGIYSDDVPVGFLMIGYDTDPEWENPPAVAKGSYNIWRLMIDARHQGRGYGKAALHLALDFIRTCPCAKTHRCWLSYEAENTAAKKLYASFGFRETGEKDGDEWIAVLQL